MRNRVLVVLTILLVSSSALFAQEAKPSDTPDPRLDQKVTYQAKGQLLHRVLAELTEKTGVIMTCGKNEEDWQVRDRKVSIAVKDMPLKDLQQQLSKLLRFTWARGSKDGQPTYRLFQDLKSRREEESFRTAAKEAQEKKMIERRQSAITAIEKLENLTPEQLESLKAESPMLYVLAKEPVGKGMLQLMRALPEAKSAFVNGGEYQIGLSNAPSETIDAARAYVNGIDSLIQQLDPRHRSVFGGLADNIENARVTVVNGGSSEMNILGGDDMFFGMLSVEAEGFPEAGIPLIDPTSPIANAMGKMLIKMMEGSSMMDLSGEFQTEMEKAFNEMVKSDEPDEPLPDDPDFEKLVKLELKPSDRLPEIIEELAKKTDMQVFSDHFASMMPAPSISQEEQKLGKLLKSIASAYGKQFKKTGNTIVFTDRKWFEKRAWEVAENILEYWRTAIKNGSLQLDDLVWMACLTDEQIMNTLMTDEKIRSITGQLMPNKHLLRLYAVLTESQKLSMKSQNGLDPQELTEQQWPYFEYLIGGGGRSRNTPKFTPKTPMALFLTEDEKNGAYTFTLKDLSPAEDEDPEEGEETVEKPSMTWKITLRRTPQKSEETPAGKP